MRALSLHQPWGTAIRLGLKVTETRDYGTPYRGELAIHAAKAWGKPQRAALEEFRAQWPSLQWDGQSRGGEVIALAELVAVERFAGEPDEDGCCPQYAASEADYLTGNYLQGRYGWRLQNVRLVDPPVPVKGHQSLWTLTADEAQAVRARARVPVLPLEDPPLRMPSRDLVLALERPIHGEGAPEPPLDVAQAPIQGARAPGAELEPVAGVAVGGLLVAHAARLAAAALDPVKPVLFSQLYFPDGSASQSYTLCRVVWVSQDHRVAEGVPVRGKDRTKRACAVSLLRKVHP